MKRQIPEEWLSAYVDGELTAAEQAEVESALRESSEYRQRVDDYRQMREQLQRIPRESLPGDFAARVLRAAERAMITGGESAGDASLGGASLGERAAAVERGYERAREQASMSADAFVANQAKASDLAGRDVASETQVGGGNRNTGKPDVAELMRQQARALRRWRIAFSLSSSLAALMLIALAQQGVLPFGRKLFGDQDEVAHTYSIARSADSKTAPFVSEMNQLELGDVAGGMGGMGGGASNSGIAGRMGGGGVGGAHGLGGNFAEGMASDSEGREGLELSIREGGGAAVESGAAPRGSGGLPSDMPSAGAMPGVVLGRGKAGGAPGMGGPGGISARGVAAGGGSPGPGMPGASGMSADGRDSQVERRFRDRSTPGSANFVPAPAPAPSPATEPVPAPMRAPSAKSNVENLAPGARGGATPVPPRASANAPDAAPFQAAEGAAKDVKRGINDWRSSANKSQSSPVDPGAVQDERLRWAEGRNALASDEFRRRAVRLSEIREELREKAEVSTTGVIVVDIVIEEGEESTKKLARLFERVDGEASANQVVHDETPREENSPRENDSQEKSVPERVTADRVAGDKAGDNVKRDEARPEQMKAEATASQTPTSLRAIAEFLRSSAILSESESPETSLARASGSVKEGEGDIARARNAMLAKRGSSDKPRDRFAGSTTVDNVDEAKKAVRLAKRMRDDGTVADAEYSHPLAEAGDAAQFVWFATLRQVETLIDESSEEDSLRLVGAQFLGGDAQPQIAPLLVFSRSRSSEPNLYKLLLAQDYQRPDSTLTDSNENSNGIQDSVKQKAVERKKLSEDGTDLRFYFRVPFGLNDGLASEDFLVESRKQREDQTGAALTGDAPAATPGGVAVEKPRNRGELKLQDEALRRQVTKLGQSKDGNFIPVFLTIRVVSSERADADQDAKPQDLPEVPAKVNADAKTESGLGKGPDEKPAAKPVDKPEGKLEGKPEAKPSQESSPQ